MNALKKLFALLALFGLAAFIGCTDEAPTDLLPKPGLGSVTISKYVAVGNSLAAGYQSSGLYKSAQTYSYPKLISDQLKLAGATLGTFEQPYWSDPGNPDPKTGKAARYVIISLADPNNPVIGPKGETPTAVAPENAATLARPYDNLGLPGAPLAGFMDTVGTYQGGFGAAIIRGAGGLPKSQFRAVKALQPQLVTFWLGNNDVLGYATTGGTSPAAPTPLATFTFLYNQALDTLKKSVAGVKIIVGTIPNVTTIPFFTTIGPKVGAKLAPLGAALYYQKKGESGVATGTTKFTNPSGDPLICLTGSPYAGLIGTVTGKFYKDNGFPALPAGIDTTKPFGVHPQNPWPNALTLDSAEIVIAAKAVVDFNSAIVAAAATQGAAVVDFNAIFTDINANGKLISGVKYTSAYITGGLFSLDGVHPTNRGAGVLANEIIKVMNTKFGTNVTSVDVSSLPALEIPLGKYMTSDKMLPYIAPQSWDSFLKLWQN